MFNYPHERKPEAQGPMNTIWPRMSDQGVDIDDARKYIEERGLSWTLAEANGWYPSREAMDGFLRIVIPAVSTLKDHVYWQARAVSKNVHIRYQTPKGPRHGSLIVVNFDAEREYETRRNTPGVVVVEGPMDALAVAECGHDAIALMGITPGDKALDHLVKLVNRRPAIVVLDNEPVAQAAAYVIGLRLATAGGKAHVQKIRYVKDLAAMKYEARQDWLERCVEGL